MRTPGVKKNVVPGLADRMKQGRELLNLSQAELASLCDGTTRGIQDNEAGKAMPGSRVIAALVERGLNANWLLGNVGNPLLAKGDGATTQTAARSGYVRLPLYGVEATGGHGAEVEREEVVDVIEFKESWLRQEFGAEPKDVALLFVRGQSMEPDLRPGDVIMIDRRDTTAQYEATYVLRMDGALLVKQLQRMPGGVIRVVSKAEGFREWEINLATLGDNADLAIIGRVIYTCRRF